MLFMWQNACTHVHTLSIDSHRAGGGGLVAKFCPTLVSQWTVACQALCLWDFPGKKTGVICHFLLQGIFPTQGLNLGLLHFRQILYQLSYQGRPTCNEIDIFVRPMESKWWKVDWRFIRRGSSQSKLLQG